MVLSWLYKDSESAAHTRGHRLFFGLSEATWLTGWLRPQSSGLGPQSSGLRATLRLPEL